MAVGPGVPFNQHTGNGVTKTFAFGFTLLNAGDLVVTIDGVETTDYTVAGLGVALGGSITLGTAPASGADVVLRLVIAISRATEYQTNGDLLAVTVNSDFDRLWQALGVVNYVADSRGLRVPFDETVDVLPSAANRANGLLSFDASGNPTITDVPVLPSLPVQEEIQTATDGQTVFTLATMSYTRGNNSLQVLVNNRDVDQAVSYTETSTTSVTFAEGLVAGDRVKFRAGQLLNPASAIGTVSDSALAASTGSALVGHIASGTGAVARTAQAKMRDIVSVEDFGTPSGLVSDDVVMLQKAVDAMNASGGGTVWGDAQYLVDSNFTIPDTVAFCGPWSQPGELLPGTSADYGALSGLLVVNSAATISMGDASACKGWIVMRKGLDLPFADATAATAGVAAFAGTAFTVAGSDAYLGHMLVLGFNKAVFMENSGSGNYERLRCEYVTGDCTNGLDIQDCYDKSYYDNCHFWPWTTVHQSWTTNALLRRTGTAYKLSTSDDWASLTNCFSYGYFRGYEVIDCNSVTFIGCGADNTSTAAMGDHVNARGFSVSGASSDVRFIACQAAAQYTGYYVNVTTADYHTKLTECDAWACVDNGIRIDAGDTSINGGTIRNTSNGVLINNTTARVFIDFVRFSGLSSRPVGFNVANSTTFIGKNNDYNGVALGGDIIAAPSNYVPQSIAAASPLLPPANVNGLLTITGGTSFAAISGGWLGRELVMLFTGTPTLTHGTGSNALFLKGAVNRTMATGSTIRLIHNGTQWYEI